MAWLLKDNCEKIKILSWKQGPPAPGIKLPDRPPWGHSGNRLAVSAVQAGQVQRGKLASIKAVCVVRSALSRNESCLISQFLKGA